jgi:hypothetical protein
MHVRERHLLREVQRSGPRAKTAHEIDCQANQQDQPEATPANGRTAKIKTATAEQNKKHNDDYEQVHGPILAVIGNFRHGV